MPNPFPGMNPYLENPVRWRGVHARLIAAIDEQLNQSLPPPFVSSIEERVYLALPSQLAYPDIALVERPAPRESSAGERTATLRMDAPFIATLDERISERYIEIRAVEDTERVVAVIEVLSPTNKARESYGRDSYVKKRDQFVQSDAHFVEIDLLREGLYSVAVPLLTVISYAGEGWSYMVNLRRAGEENVYHFWPTALRAPLPRIGIPLTGDFADVPVDLQECVNHVYDAGRLERRIDYAREPVPPLSPDDAAWADALLKTAGFR